MTSLRHRAGGLLVGLILAACSTAGEQPDSNRTASPIGPGASVGTEQAGATPRPVATAEAPVFGAVPVGPTEPAVVLSITDGDTIRVDRGRGSEPVRYIGVDAPELADPGQPGVQAMATEATAANRALVEGREVLLERDVSELDRFDRLLRYVWVRDGDDWTMVNLALVAGGYAQVVTYPPDVRYAELYLEAQREARGAGRGLWGDIAAQPTAAQPTPAPPTAAPIVPLVPQVPAENCDPAYPGVCIRRAPPDLDCGDIPFRRFEVRPPDPHRFDGDRDGIGCEGS